MPVSDFSASPDFSYSDFSGSDDFDSRSDFSGSSLSVPDFSSSDFSGSVVSFSTFSGSDFSCSGFSVIYVSVSKNEKKTRNLMGRNFEIFLYLFQIWEVQTILP